MKHKASLIISFYNKIEWLKLLLAACEQQSIKEFEVIIADDGSREEVVNEIKILQKNSTLSLQHLWHPDTGFTKTIMMNKAILASKSDYLIFIDGDCIPHAYFVEDHLRLQKENRVLAGRRVNLSDVLSKRISVPFIKRGGLSGIFLLKLFWDGLTNKSRDAEKGIHIGNLFLNEKFGSTKKGLLGCNFSLSKRNMLAVNGFDERYQFPGVGEDTEIAYRFKKMGLTIFRPKFCLVQYHLWHKLLSREQEPINLKLFQETKDKGYIATPYGLKN